MEKANLREIEHAISQFSNENLAEFRTWFAEFDAVQWDRQFQADVAKGRLNAVAEKALESLRKRNCSDL